MVISDDEMVILQDKPSFSCALVEILNTNIVK